MSSESVDPDAKDYLISVSEPICSVDRTQAEYLPELHTDVQDTDCASWSLLLEQIDEAAADNREEFSPDLGKPRRYSSPIVTLPSTINKLTRVKHLNLYGSDLIAIPPEIGQMRSLERFTPYTSRRLVSVRDHQVCRTSRLDGEHPEHLRKLQTANAVSRAASRRAEWLDSCHVQCLRWCVAHVWANPDVDITPSCDRRSPALGSRVFGGLRPIPTKSGGGPRGPTSPGRHRPRSAGSTFDVYRSLAPAPDHRLGVRYVRCCERSGSPSSSPSAGAN
jgi:hypothetical protein